MCVPYQVAKFMPALIQQTPQQSQQHRSRFEPPQPGQGLLGHGGSMAAGGGPGCDSPRMPGMPNTRDDFFDPKRMRRF